MTNTLDKYFLLLLLSFCIGFSSCVSTSETLSSVGIEKRRYTKGYHIDLSKKTPISNLQTKTWFLQESVVEPIRPKPGKKEFIKTKIEKLATKILKKLNATRDSSDCGDVLTLRSGKVISVKVISIDKKEITYKKCNNLTGPFYVTDKSSVLKIEYPNGDIDEFEEVAEVYYKEPSRDTEYTQYAEGDQTIEGLALASILSIVMSVASIFIGIIIEELILIASPVFALLAIIFGGIALGKIQRSNGTKAGEGMAIAGITLGILYWTVILLIFAIDLL